jgi:heptosyltransferase-2
MIKSELSQKILVIRLSSLGDVVLTGPVYKSLKEHWPQSTIYALVKAPYASVLDGHPGVDHVIIYRGLFETLKEIRKVGFTHLLDLHGNVRSRLIRLMSGIPNKVAYSKDALSRRLFVSWRYPSPPFSGMWLIVISKP